MQNLNAEQPYLSPSTGEWIQSLNTILARTDQNPRKGNRATLSCRKIDDKPVMFVPRELPTLQPDLLRYLHALGSSNGITLVEDRRSIDIQPIRDRRDSKPSKMAMGVSLLLKQTGLPGPAHGLSRPHLLEAGNRKIDLVTLIRMSASVYGESKKVVFIPNRLLAPNKDDRTPMTGYACQIRSGDDRFLLSYFNAPEFHAIGYNAGTQFVLHVLLAGGSISNPEIWSPFETLTDSTFRCQILADQNNQELFGLLYSTFYIDLASSMHDNLVKQDKLSRAV